MDRLDKVRFFIDRDMKGLEIGPSFNPIAPKRDGWNVETIDHLSREELVEKYKPHGVDVAKIEDVDWVWGGEALDVLVGPDRQGAYDYFIASHVIEHIPDLLGFLNAVESLLKIGGVLTLVIPDKRHCFDFFKSLTSTADVLYAHELKRERHTKKTAFEEIAYATSRGGQHIWDERHIGSLALMHTLESALAHFQACDESPVAPYADFHCTFFVPASFELLIEELAALNQTQFEIFRTFPGAGCEFYVTLRKVDRCAAEPIAIEQRQNRRLELLKRVVRELASEAIVD